jgi:NAD+ kinase
MLLASPHALRVLARVLTRVWPHARGRCVPLQVFVERSVHAAECPHLEAFDPASSRVDLAITLGGDGTVLHLASLFAEDAPLPPVMCFAMGTLGFLTPFDAAHFRSCLVRGGGLG